jgi:AcrR family transcriptional regulator
VTTTGARQRLGPEQRREQLMAAAVQVLADRGYAGATASAIAVLAGTSKGLLWHYFTDLDDLFEQTARRTLAGLAAVVGASLDLEAPAPEIIRAAVHAAAALQRTHRTERRAMREIVANLRTAAGELRVDQSDLDELYAGQEAIFRRGQQQGQLRADLDPRLVAVVYQGAVDSMLGYLDAYPETDADQLAGTVADVLLGGLAVVPGRR